MTPRNLLDLPTSIRISILEYAGLLRPCPISLIEEKDRLRRLPDRLQCQIQGKSAEFSCQFSSDYRKISCVDIRDRFCNGCDDVDLYKFHWQQKAYAATLDPVQKHAIHCTHPPLQVSILFVCKQLYRDAVPVLYSGNHFVLDCQWHPEILRLQLLNPYAYSLFRNLHVLHSEPVFDEIGTLKSHDEKIDWSLSEDWYDIEAVEEYYGVWRRRQARPRVTENQFRDFCASLGNGIKPAVCNISVSAHLGNLEAVQLFLSALELLPPLRNIALNVGADLEASHSTTRAPLESSLRRFVKQKSISNLRDLTRAKSPFPFTRLPLELQHRVFSEAGLRCSESHIAKHHEGVPISFAELARREKLSSCCKTCFKLPDGIIRPGPYRCSCCKNSRYSNTCSCFRLPIALFSVSRSFRSLASNIFFALNHFDCDSLLGYPSPPSPNMDLRSLNFLMDTITLISEGEERHLEDGTEAVKTPARIKKIFEICKQFCNPSTMVLELEIETSRVSEECYLQFLLDVSELRFEHDFGRVEVDAIRFGETTVYRLDKKGVCYVDDSFGRSICSYDWDGLRNTVTEHATPTCGE